MIDMDFQDRVREVKKELNISEGRQTESDRRRIAIYMTEEAFAYGLDVVKEASLFERRLYDLLKDTNLRCDLIPEEIRIRDEGIQGFNVLTLSFEPRSVPDMSIDFESYAYDPVIKDILDILTAKAKAKKKGEVKDAGKFNRSVPPGIASEWSY